MKILKLLLTTVLTFNCVDICKASCESIATYIASQPNFFKLGLSDLKADIREKLNTPLTYEEEKEFNQKMWRDKIDEEKVNSSLIQLLEEYYEVKDEYDNPRSWFLSDYIPCRIDFTTEFFLEKFLDKKFLNDEIFIPDDQLSDDASDLLEKFKDSLEKFGLTKMQILKFDNVFKFTNEEIKKILFLKNYLAESFSEFIPEFYSDIPNRTPLESFKYIIKFDLCSLISSRVSEDS